MLWRFPLKYVCDIAVANALIVAAKSGLREMVRANLASMQDVQIPGGSASAPGAFMKLWLAALLRSKKTLQIANLIAPFERLICRANV